MGKGLRSLSQVRLLMAVASQPKRPHTDLAIDSGIHPSNFQVMFRQLVRLGLVYEVSERITPTGRKLIQPFLRNDNQ